MKLVTWNTQWCCGLDGLVSPRRIVEVAHAWGDVDVLCLQEVCVNYPGLRGQPAHDQPALIQALLPGYQVFFGPAVQEWTGEGPQQFGNLLATRLPVLQVQHHALPYPADPGVRSMPRMCTTVTLVDPALGAIRVMTTHLEYHSARQRMAQAIALRQLHLQACAHAQQPPCPATDGSPFQTKPHTPHAVLCGDLNLTRRDADYAALTAASPEGRWWDAWPLLHGDTPPTPTFKVFDKTYGPEAEAFDFVLVSDTLRQHVQRMQVNTHTQASDHQPVFLELG